MPSQTYRICWAYGLTYISESVSVVALNRLRGRERHLLLNLGVGAAADLLARSNKRRARTTAGSSSTPASPWRPCPGRLARDAEIGRHLGQTSCVRLGCLSSSCTHVEVDVVVALVCIVAYTVASVPLGKMKAVVVRAAKVNRTRAHLFF
jgi:hypothetical protein